MAEITVRAVDSALAMEEIQKRLGDDALIISTTKKDGQIEIVATDEDIAGGKKLKDPLILDTAYRADNFSTVFKKNLENLNVGRKDELNNHYLLDFARKSDSITHELQELKSFVLNNYSANKPAYDTKEKLRFIGFNKTFFQYMPELATNISEEAAVTKIAKQFVNGKCRNFDSSEIYIITGEKNSGKSVFCQKFFKFMEVTYDDRVFIKPIHQNEKKLIHTLSQVKKNNENNRNEVLIIEASNEPSDLGVLVAKIEEKHPNIKISIIETIATGNSFEKLTKNFKSRGLKNEYIAFTKLDLCDISIPEIAAVLENSKKCMFFSGIDKINDGLYFAKVDQIKSHLFNKLNKEVE
jgi:flagellar biosynthesis GTPase FlhF